MINSHIRTVFRKHVINFARGFVPRAKLDVNHHVVDVSQHGAVKCDVITTGQTDRVGADREAVNENVVGPVARLLQTNQAR